MKPRSVVNVTEPSVEPVSFADMKAQSRIDDATEESLVDFYVSAARKHAELFTRRRFISQQLRANWDEFPPDELVLPRGPTIAVDSIAYVDENGVSQTWGASNYQTDTDSDLARVKPVVGGSWPSIQGGAFNAVSVTFTAGHGAAATDVPPEARHAIRLLAAHWFENREPVVVGKTSTPLPWAVESLLWGLRIDL